MRYALAAIRRAMYYAHTFWKEVRFGWAGKVGIIVSLSCAHVLDWQIRRRGVWRDRIGMQ